MNTKSDAALKPNECIRERFVVVDDFLPTEQCQALRNDIDQHFAEPGKHGLDHQVWNYWHVPGLYTYLRTMPEKVVLIDRITAFVERLRSWSAWNLGLGNACWPWLSLYVPGCSQGLHNDSANGRLGYVYSLTRNQRATIGGETVLVQDRDLFRGNLDRPAAGTALYDLVPPDFNRLVLFDDRIPHAVQRVDGSMDPLEGRLVLHGHISESGPVVDGALPASVIEEQAAPMLETLRGGAGRGARGPLVYRIEISRDGSVVAAEPILDRLASSGDADLDFLKAAALAAISRLRFPEAPDATRANVPLIF